jgi:ABC-type bacteriocin/lantibiotic exporter with double-glycine peptidase domain
MGRAVPYVAQLELADCAAACLAMTLAYHGRYVPLEELRDATGTGRDGVGAPGIVAAARQYGLMARGVKAETGDLACLPPGSVLHWDFDHFVVFEKVTPKGVAVVDPALGRRVVPAGDRHLLIILTVTMAAMAGYYFLISLVRAHLLLHLRTHVDRQLTTEFISHLARLPYAFFLRRPAGDLMMRLQSNSTVREILTTGSLSALLDGGMATAYLVLLLIISPPLGLLVLVLGAAQVAATILARRSNQRLTTESLEAQARSESYAYQLLAGIGISRRPAPRTVL